jgi:hypothetical protein
MPRILKIRKRLAGGAVVDQLYQQTKNGFEPVKFGKINGAVALIPEMARTLPIRIGDFGIPRRPKTGGSIAEVQETPDVKPLGPPSRSRKYDILKEINKSLKGGMLKIM